MPPLEGSAPDARQDAQADALAKSRPPWDQQPGNHLPSPSKQADFKAELSEIKKDTDRKEMERK